MIHLDLIKKLTNSVITREFEITLEFNFMENECKCIGDKRAITRLINAIRLSDKISWMQILSQDDLITSDLAFKKISDNEIITSSINEKWHGYNTYKKYVNEIAK